MIETDGLGGAEMDVLNLASHIHDVAFESMVLVVGGGVITEILEQRGIPFRRLSFSRSYSYHFVNDIRIILDEYEVDIVQSHLARMNNYGMLAARAYGIPNIMTVHGTAEFSLRKQRMFYRILGSMSTAVIAVSGSLKRTFCQETGVGTEKVTVIHNGIDAGQFRPSKDKAAYRRDFNLPDDGFVLAAVGNIRAIKRYDLLLDALAIIIRTIPNTILIVAGADLEGRQKDLTAQTAERNLDSHVRFLGQVSDASTVYNAADVYVLSSESEGFSITTLEAMAASLPVVVTDCGGPTEIVDTDVNGFIVPNEDAEALAERVIRLHGNATLRAEMGQAGRQKVSDQFSLGPNIALHKQLYRDVLTKAGNPEIQVP
jgi:glycosyltransferase involved in cell wall biosynthesis